MLLPARLSGMKLNGGRHWSLPAVAPRVGAAEYPAAFSRIIGTPMVAGDNDAIGDCFPTACANAVQTVLWRRGICDTIPDNLAVEAYEDMTGYNPAAPASDQGTVPDQGFTWWKANHIGGYRLSGLSQIAATSEGEVRAAIASAGGVLLCVELAVEQQNQRQWMPVGTPGSWGGHAVWCDGYEGATYRITSWGEEFFVDRGYFAAPGFVAGVYRLDLAAT